MKTFESKFEDYFVALGNEEQVTIYNHFAGANLCPLVYNSKDINVVFENLTPKQIIDLVKKGDFESYHDWFYLNENEYMQGIDIVPEWLKKYIPAMAKYYSLYGNVLVAIDAKTKVLFCDNVDNTQRYNYTDLLDILDVCYTYLRSTDDESVLEYFNEFVESSLFHDAIGKIVQREDTMSVIVTTEY